MTDDNVINFPRIGFVTPPTPAGDAGNTPPAGPAWAPAPGSRRSPLDTLAALPAPGLTAPVIPAPEPGFVPDTFRSEPVGDVFGPRLGALSLAAVLAVSVAALRGIHSAVTAWKANREQRKAVQAVADTSKAAAGSGGGGKKRKVPPSHEYGSKSLRRDSGGGGRSGSSSKGSAGNGSGGPSGRKKSSDRSSSPAKPKNSAGSTGGASSPKPKAKKNPRPVHRPSQGGLTTKHKKQPSNGKATADPKAARVKAPTGTAGPKGTLRSKKPKEPDVLKKLKRRIGKGGSSKKPTKGTPKAKSTRPGGGRTTLAEAVRKTVRKGASQRWKRRTPPTPPVWKASKKTSTGPKPQAAGKPGPGPTSKQKTSRAAKGHGKKRAGSRAGYWDEARRRARARWDKRRANTAQDFTGQSSTAADGDDFWFEFVDGQYTADPRGNARTRRSPWESAGMAGGMDGSTITVERADRPNSHTGPAVGTGVPALPAAATPHTKRPRTTKPIPMPAAPPRTPRTPTMTTPAHLRTPAMDPRHATEITLDDALDVLEQLTRESFTTHDECVGLAQRARGIRNRLEDLAIDLLATHNVIGHLTGAAMVRLAESMDVLARKADEMQASSLQAAELSEAADNSLNDAYRPITQATADAGLAVPSARIHNES